MICMCMCVWLSYAIIVAITSCSVILVPLLLVGTCIRKRNKFQLTENAHYQGRIDSPREKGACNAHTRHTMAKFKRGSKMLLYLVISRAIAVYYF